MGGNNSAPQNNRQSITKKKSVGRKSLHKKNKSSTNRNGLHNISENTETNGGLNGGLNGKMGFKFNKKLTVNDFEFLKVVGKGSFGKVMQVKKNDDGKIYALKVLKKKELVKRKQVNTIYANLRVIYIYIYI